MPTLTLATVAQLGVAWWLLRGAGAGAVRSSARMTRRRPMLPGGRIAFVQSEPPVGTNGESDDTAPVPPIPEDDSPRGAGSRQRERRPTARELEPVPGDPLPDRPESGDAQMAGLFSWFESAADNLTSQWRDKLAEWSVAREQFETDRETARGLIRLAKQVDRKAKQSGATPAQLAPLRIVRLRVEGILAADQSRANRVARVDGLIRRAITAGAPADGLGLIPLLPIAAIGAAIAAIVVAVAWMRTHSRTIVFETEKLAAITSGLLTAEQLTALAETGLPLTLGQTFQQFGKVALGAAVLIGVLLYAKNRMA